MKCCGRYNFGIIIGSLYLVGCIILFIFLSVLLIDINSGENDQHDVIKHKVSAIYTYMAISFFVALICGLLIWGIVNRRHYLMLPWLITYVICFVISCFMFFYGYLAVVYFNPSDFNIFITLITAIVATVLQTIIFFFMCTLYRGIRKENNEKPHSVIENQQVVYRTLSKREEL